jgi:hypothetical protein
MTRRSRIALEILGPPALGAACWLLAIGGWTLWEAMTRGKPAALLRQLPEMALVLFVCAYFFAGVPSLLYAAIMEWRFARGLDPASWRTVGWSTGLGLASGAAIIGVLSGGRAGLASLAVFGALGLIVGALLGGFIKWRSGRGRSNGLGG